MSKLLGALKAGLSFQPPAIAINSEQKKPVIERSRKEKEIYCSNAEKTIVEIFAAKTEEEINRGADEVFGSLAVWCADEEQDMRILADETLNKVLKVVQLNWPGRMLSLLMKQLSKSTLPIRSLKAILQKISNVSHLVKPSKARFHAQNLVEIMPALVELNEDVVHEALGHMLCKVAPALFYYASDAEVKSVVRQLLRPLCRPSSVQQRAASSAIAAVCQSARKPILTASWAIAGIIRMLLPVDNLDSSSDATSQLSVTGSLHQQEKHIGLMMALRSLLNTLSSTRIGDLDEAVANEQARSSIRHVLNSSMSSTSSGPKPVISCEHLIIIFELCIHFCSSSSQVALITVSLEALVSLFHVRSKPFKNYLTTPNSTKCTWRIFPEGAFIVDEYLCELNEEFSNSKISGEGDDKVSVSDFPDGAIMSGMSTSVSRLAVDRSDSQSVDSLTLLPVSGGSSLTSGVIVGESLSGTRRPSVASTGGSSIVAGLTAELDEIERDVRQERLTASKSDEQIFGEVSSHDQRSIDYNMDEDSKSTSTKRSGHSRTNTMTSNASFNMSSPSAADASAYSNDASIGLMTDPGGVPLVFAVRLLSKRFLLSGYSGVLLSDRLARISFKGLALSSLGAMLSSHPSVFLNKLFPAEMVNQPLTDILLYSSHQDSHLKAALVSLVGNFIYSVLVSSQNNPDSWAKEHGDALPLSSLIDIFETVLTASSDQHLLKSTLVAVKLFLSLLLQSSEANLGFALLHRCMALQSKTYWLLKVELLEVFSKLDLMVVNHLDPCYCDMSREIVCICVGYLSDDDVRVRTAAAKTLAHLIAFGNLPTDQEAVQDILLSRARCLVIPITNDAMSIQQLNGSSSSWLPPVFALPSAFTSSQQRQKTPVDRQQGSVVVNSTAAEMLMKQIYVKTTNLSDVKYISGAISFYLRLAENHRPALNLQSWSGVALPILNLSISLITSTNYSIDLTNHAELLRLATHLVACVAVKDVRKIEMISYTKPRDKWSHIVGPNADSVRRVIETLLVHSLRMLNLYSHVFGTIASGNSTLLHLIRAPVRSITSSAQQAISRGRAAVGSDSGNVQPSSAGPSSNTASSVQAEFDRLFRGNTVGECINQPNFARIHKQLLKAFASYRLSSELCLSNEKFGQLLAAVLHLLSTLLELSSLNEVRPILEETVAYLRSALLFQPNNVIEAVYQLLKSLFGCSLVAHWDPATMLSAAGGANTFASSDMTSNRVVACVDGDSRSSSLHGFYHACLVYPYTIHTQLLASMSTNMTASTSQLFSSFSGGHSGDDGYSLLEDLRMCVRRTRNALIFEQRAASGQPPSRADRELVESLIHPFEAIVIQSIRLYTLSSSDLDTQRTVLRLLTQLIYLRANYSLLDSNGAFLQCVIRQLEDLDHPSDLRRQLWLEDAFTFLSAVGLNQIQSKQPPLSFADLLELTDTIIANTHHIDKLIALPCLKRIVVDLFLPHPARSTTQQLGNEILAQMECVVSKLCKLTHPRVYPCLIVVLQSSRVQGEDRWKRVSRQISDIVLPSLETRDTPFSSRADFENLVSLLSNLTASVFRPVDFIFRVLYRQSSPGNSSSSTATAITMTIASASTNLATVVALTCVLLVHSKEDMMLARIREFFREPVGQESPYAGQANSSEPENAFISFQLDTIVDSVKLLVDKLSDVAAIRLGTPLAEIDFLAFLVSKSLLNILHIVHSGHFPRCIKSLRTYIESLRLDTLWSTFGRSYPLPTLLWYQLVVLITDGRGLPWNDLCATLAQNSQSWSSAFMLSTLLSLAADHLCERTDDVERLSWLLTCHSGTLLSLISEATLRDLIVSCHRQSSASGLLVQAIVGALAKAAESRSSTISPHLMCRGLHAIETVHPDQQFTTLQLVVEKLLPTCRQWPQVKRRLADLVISLSTEITSRKAELPPEFAEVSQHWIQTLTFNLPPLLSSRPVKQLKKLMASEEPTPQPSAVDDESVLAAVSGTTLLAFYKQLCAFPHSVFAASPLTAASIAEIILSQHSSEWANMISQVSSPGVLEQILLTAAHHCRSVGFEHMLSNSTCSNNTNNVDGDNHVLAAGDADLTFEMNSYFQSVMFISNGGSDTNTNVYAKLIKSIAEQCCVLVKTVLGDFPLPAAEVHCIDRFPEDLEESAIFTCASSLNRNRLLALISYIESLHEAYSDNLDLLVAVTQPICRLLDICSGQHRHLLDEISGFYEWTWLVSFLLVQYSRWHITVVKCLPESDVLLACLRLACYTLTAAQTSEQGSSSCSWISSFYWTQLVSLLALLMRSHPINAGRVCVVPDLHTSHARLVVNACIEVFVRPCSSQGDVDAALAPFSKEILTFMRALCFLVSRLPPLYEYALLPRDLLASISSTNDINQQEQQTTVYADGMSPYMLFEPDTLCDFLRRLSFVGWVSRPDFEEIWSRLLSVLNHYLASGDVERPKEERIEITHCCCLAIRGLTSLLCKTRRLAPKRPCQWVMAASSHQFTQNSNFHLYPQLTPLALLQSPSYRQYAVVRARLNEGFFVNSNNYCRSPAQLFCTFLERVVLNSCDTETLIRNAGLEQYVADDGNSDTASESMTSSVMMSDSTNFGEDIYLGAGLDLNSCLQFLLDLYTRWLVPSLRVFPAQLPPRALILECVSSLVLISDLFTTPTHWESMSSMLFAVYGEIGAEDENLMPLLTVCLAKVAAVLQLPNLQVNQVTTLVVTCLGSKLQPLRIGGLHASIFLMQSRHQALVKPVIEKMFADRQTLLAQQPTQRPAINAMLSFAASAFLLENFSNYVDSANQQFLTQIFQGYFQPNQPDETENPELYTFVCQCIERLVLTDGLAASAVSAIMTAVQIQLPSLVDNRRWTAAIGLLITGLYRLAASGQQRSVGSSATGIINVQQQQQVADVTRFANLERVATFAEKARSSAVDPQRQLQPGHLSHFAQMIGDVMFDLIAPADLLSRVIGDLSTCPFPGPQLAFTAVLVARVFSRLLACDQRQTLFDWALPSLTSLVQRQPMEMAVLTQIALLAPLTEKPLIQKGLALFLPALYSVATVEQILHIKIPVSTDLMAQSATARLELSAIQLLKFIVSDFYNQLNGSQRKLLLATYTSAGTVDSTYHNLVAALLGDEAETPSD